MKKIISIVAILFFFATTYAQEVKPTKQETMDWIGNKFTGCTGSLSTDKKFLHSFQNEYNNGAITINATSSDKLYDFVFYIDLTKLNKCEYVINDDGYEVKISGISGFGYYKDAEKKISQNEITIFGIYKRTYGKVTGGFINENCELDLKKRLITAFQTLAEYNNLEKPNEKF